MVSSKRSKSFKLKCPDTDALFLRPEHDELVGQLAFFVHERRRKTFATGVRAAELFKSAENFFSFPFQSSGGSGGREAGDAEGSGSAVSSPGPEFRPWSALEEPVRSRYRSLVVDVLKAILGHGWRLVEPGGREGEVSCFSCPECGRMEEQDKLLRTCGGCGLDFSVWFSRLGRCRTGQAVQD